MPYMCGSEILQMRGASQNWNNACKYGPFCELFFFLVKHEPAKGEVSVGSPFGLCEYMPTLESIVTEPYGGKTEATLFQGVLSLSDT